MSTVQYSTKLKPEQINSLKRISDRTHIPQTVLIREAVDMLIEELDKKTVSLDFLGLVKRRVKEDKRLLNKLSNSQENRFQR